MLGWLVDHKIEPHIPVWDKGEHDGAVFSRSDFAYDKEKDIYICPAGKTLRTTGTLHADNIYCYIARKPECDSCPLKPQCAPKSGPRRVLRDRNEEARDVTRAIMETKAYRISRAERKKIATLFGEAKSILSMVKLRLRGLTGARDEFLLTATVQNLKRLASRPVRPRPQPQTA